MFKALIGKQVDELYKQIDEKEAEIRRLQDKIDEMHYDKSMGIECGSYCANCIHGYLMTAMPFPVYGCELKITCGNYKNKVSR